MVARQRQEDPELHTSPCSLQITPGNSCAPVGDALSKFFRQLGRSQRFFLSPLGLDNLQLEIICVIILRWHIFFLHRIHAWTPLRRLSRRSEKGFVFQNIKGHLGDLPGGPVVEASSNTEGAGSIPAWGTKIPLASRPKRQNMEQKQYCNRFKTDFKKNWSIAKKRKKKKKDLKN